MRFDADSGYWTDEIGKRFIKNEFNPTAPTYISVTENGLEGFHLNKIHRLQWPVGFTPSLQEKIEGALALEMRKKAPSRLRNYELMLRGVARGPAPVDEEYFLNQ